MAKKINKPHPSQAAITLEFDLFDLPSAQHKAGLAGLVMLIQSLPDANNGPTLEALTPTTARVRFTEDSLQTLFNDLYDAKPVEVASPAKWPGQPPKYETTVEVTDPESGKTKKSKRYVYGAVQPKGRFLQENLSDGNGAWLKLWQDMVWTTLRGRPTTRIPFNERAEGKPCSEATKAWRELTAFQKAKAKNELRTCEVAGALFLGSQAVNAESIPFQGRSDHSLLLHFWQTAILTFVPQILDSDGAGAFAGYVLAIPEVSDLQEFMRLYPRMLRNLRSDMRGYRPADSVIDIPQQGALELFYNLGRLSSGSMARKDIVYAVSAVDFFQMTKVGNNVKTIASGTVPLNEELIENYQAIRQEYRNPLFRSAALLAMLRDQPWHRPFSDLFAKRPWEFFVKSDGTPATIPWFAADAATKFRHLTEQNELY